MREVNLDVGHTVSIPLPLDQLANLPNDDSKSFGAVDIGESAKEIAIARLNGGKILYSAIDITQRIEDIICDYLFGTSISPSKEKNFFNNEIIQTSSLTFQFKKEVLKKMIKSEEYLEGKAKGGFYRNLDQIMTWRNAFAHGKLVFNIKRGVLLGYYSGERKELLLDNKFWNLVEETFSEVKGCLKIVSDKIHQ